jgi:UMF1 family MFS transporter
VALATKIFASQVAGFLPIVGLLLLGLIGLFFVKGGDKQT